TRRSGSGSGRSGSSGGVDAEPSEETMRIHQCVGESPTVTDGDGEDVGYHYGIAELGVMQPLTTGTMLTVVEVDGRWYVSPLRSVFAPLLSWLRGLDRDAVERWLAAWDDLFGWSPSGRFEPVGSPLPGEGSPSGTVPWYPDEPYPGGTIPFDEEIPAPG